MIFCIEQSDVVKAKALVQFFSRVDEKTQNRVLYELSKSPEQMSLPVLDYLCEKNDTGNEMDDKIYNLIMEITYGNPDLVIERLKKKGFKNKITYIRIAGDLKMKETVPVLADMSGRNPDEKETEEIIKSLGAIGEQECVPALISFLQSDDGMLKAAGISALSDIGSDLAIDQLSKAAGRDDTMDQNVIDGLSKIQNQASLEKLSGMLGSDLVGIRSKAIESLIKIGPKAVPGLMKNLNSEDSDLQVHSLTVLGGIGDKTAAPAIQELIYKRPENSNVRFAAYESLGRLPSTRTAISLAGGLDDPDEQVQMAAAKAIDKNLTNVLIAGLKNLIKAGDDDSKRLVATFIDSESDHVFETLCEWDTFTELASDYLAVNAHPEVRDHYIQHLESRGKIQIVEMIEKTVAANQESGQDSSRQGQKRLVYAVDDSTMMLKLYMKKLHKLGFHPVTFQRPEEAIGVIRKSKPDLVLTDLNMPGVNGLQLTQVLRKQFDSKQLPVIMVTTQSDFIGGDRPGTSQPVSAADMEAAGVDRILHKPFSDKELAAAVTVALAADPGSST